MLGPVLSYMGSPSSAVIVYNESSTTSASYYFGPSQTSIFNVSGTLYAFGGECGSILRRWEKSTDNGASWTSGGATLSTYYGGSAYLKSEFADSIYYEDEGLFLVSYFHGTSLASESGIRFISGSLVATNVAWSDNGFVWCENVGFNDDDGTTAITVANGVPVIVGYFKNTTDYYFGVYWGNTANATSFTEQSKLQNNVLGITGRFAVDVHAYNSTAVLVTLERYYTDYPVYGCLVDKNNGWGTAFQITEDNKEADTLYDSNYQMRTAFSSVSNNTIDYDQYATDLVFYSYVNSSEYVRYGFLNMTTLAVSESDLALDVTDPSWVGTARHYNTYWVSFLNETDATNKDLLLYEVYENGTQVGPTTLETGLGFTSSAHHGYIMSRTPSYNRLSFIYQDENYDTWFVGIEAYGEAPEVEEEEEYTLWDWLYDLFVNDFMFVLFLIGVAMIFFGFIWLIQKVRDRDIKQAVNGLIIFIVGLALTFGWLLG